MATTVYETDIVTFMDGTELYLSPLKIKFLREFMDKFELVKTAKNDDEAITFLVSCALVSMKQYYPEIKTAEQLEDLVDLKTVYRILDVSAGIKINQEKTEETVKKQATESATTWETLDLAKIESEAFLLGIWKDYEELESSLSMPELQATLEAKRQLDYYEKKFFASLKGIDLDAESDKKDAWEEMKARVFSGGQASDSNDVLALQGVNAQKAGFGIGMGLSYERID